ncbi:NAD(P)H:quinone oxidoreductase-like [Typha angustifolia]|uniref:NAD(P)H:quinone oxidoreductase-like n=1 Tax=Typha angustifolia TaxID=59011 RepID=UPI003C2FDF98
MEGETSAAWKKPVINVAAICGSLRRASFNRGLVRSAIEICDGEPIEGMRIELIDISSLPFLNTDLEVGGAYPPAVEAFRGKIREADAILFASPEYNYSLSGPLKNAIDWASRPPNSWADKAAAIISAGGNFGGGRAQYHLRQVGVYLDLHFINKPELFVYAFQPPEKFDSDGNLIDRETKERLKKILLSLLAFTRRLQGRSEDSGSG